MSYTATIYYDGKHQNYELDGEDLLKSAEDFIKKRRINTIVNKASEYILNTAYDKTLKELIDDRYTVGSDIPIVIQRTCNCGKCYDEYTGEIDKDDNVFLYSCDACQKSLLVYTKEFEETYHYICPYDIEPEQLVKLFGGISTDSFFGDEQIEDFHERLENLVKGKQRYLEENKENISKPIECNGETISDLINFIVAEIK
ncbi:hypothetical protein BX667DRAFT_508697 [Coemansia mojavensis]|nr:hypothetical protein BX667DRAFT_508697 [Coemansia mojavensis]